MDVEVDIDVDALNDQDLEGQQPRKQGLAAAGAPAKNKNPAFEREQCSDHQGRGYLAARTSRWMQSVNISRQASVDGPAQLSLSRGARGRAAQTRAARALPAALPLAAAAAVAPQRTTTRNPR